MAKNNDFWPKNGQKWPKMIKTGIFGRFPGQFWSILTNFCSKLKKARGGIDFLKKWPNLIREIIWPIFWPAKNRGHFWGGSRLLAIFYNFEPILVNFDQFCFNFRLFNLKILLSIAFLLLDIFGLYGFMYNAMDL